MTSSATVGRLRVGLSLDKAALQEGMKQAKAGLARFSADVSKRLGALGNIPGVRSLQGALSSIGTNAAAAMGKGAAVAATALAGLSVSAINAAGEIQNLSRLSNAMPEEFQAWAAGARTVGVEQDKLADILKDMNDRVGDFISTGGGPMKDFFEVIAPKVGVTADQFRKLSGPQALQLYVDSLEKANVNQQDFTFYMEAIASDSTALLPLLKNGGKAMQEYAARAKALGGVMSNDTVRALASMKTSLSEVGIVMRGVRNTLGAAFAPMVDSIAKAFVSLMTKGSGLRVVFDGIAGAVRILVNFMSSMVTIVSSVASGLWNLTKSAARAFDEVTGLSDAFRLMIANSPVGLIYRAVTGLSALIKATGGVSGAFSELRNVAAEVFDRIGVAFDMVPAAIKAGVESMKRIFFAGLHDMLANFSWFLSRIASGFNKLFGTTLSEAEPFQDAIAGLSEASSDAKDAAGAAAGELKEVWSRVSAPLQSVARINRLIAKSAEDAANSLGDGAGGAGGGLAAATDKAGKSGSKAAAKLTPLQEVLKRLREESEKLKATLWMSDTEATVWENLREAKVAATSQSGKEIAALTRTNEGLKQLKESTDSWRDSLKTTFGDLVSGASSFKDALRSVLQQLAKMWADSAFMSLWGGTGMGKWFSGLLPKIGANANGTNNWRGGLTRINERGGEIVDLPSGTRIIPHDVSMRMADRAAQVERTAIEIIPSPYFDTRVAQISTAGDMRTAQMARQAMPGQLRDMQARGTR
ncbi:hypothetical protein SAMN04244548_03197 [Paracoccus pantotrophus]|nr:hypothetical protein SAMN04244548_03197 [Paracoccus pantotrophus]